MKQPTHPRTFMVLPATAVASFDDVESRARRLDDGYARIDQGIAAGEDVTAWEDFWIRLLNEYEAICDDLAEAA